MLAVAVSEPNKLEVVDIPEPTPGPYEAKIRTEAACLCNATDRKLIEGHFPGVENYPLLLGHETVGIVESVGEKVRNFKPGDRVVGGLLLKSTAPRFHSGWGGFSQYLLAGDHKAMVADEAADARHGWVEVHEIMRAVPKTISAEDALMLSMWREVYGAFDDFNLRKGDEIVVFGAGPVGLSFIKFAGIMGIHVVACVEPVVEKHGKALEMGAGTTLLPEESQLQDLKRRHGKPFDALIDAVGRESIINACLPLVKLGGSVCVYGVIDTPTIQLEKFKGPYNFNLLIHQWPTRAREAAAQEPLVKWIEAGKLSYKEFISAEYPVQQVQEAYDRSKTGLPIKTLLRF